MVDDQLVALTWRERARFLYSVEGNRIVLTKRMPLSTSTGEGWGATAGVLDGKQVVFVSDGSCYIHVWDAKSLKETHRKCILDPWNNNRGVDYLNDLTFAKGKLIANVWLQNAIAVIDWEKGVVTKWIDLSFLKSLVKLPSDPSRRTNAVLNGIAFDESTDDLLVTGKLWNRLFRIHLLEWRVCKKQSNECHLANPSWNWFRPTHLP